MATLKHARPHRNGWQTNALLLGGLAFGLMFILILGLAALLLLQETLASQATVAEVTAQVVVVAPTTVPTVGVAPTALVQAEVVPSEIAQPATQALAPTAMPTTASNTSSGNASLPEGEDVVVEKGQELRVFVPLSNGDSVDVRIPNNGFGFPQGAYRSGGADIECAFVTEKMEVRCGDNNEVWAASYVTTDTNTFAMTLRIGKGWNYNVVANK